jgi:hypothetical protein
VRRTLRPLYYCNDLSRFVDGRLSAYSTVDGTIFDCTGKRIAYTSSFANSDILMGDSGVQIWTVSKASVFQTTRSITAFPSNAPVATWEYRAPSLTKLSVGGYVISFSDALQAAADPRLHLLSLAKILLVRSSGQYDGCNDFVLSVGIILLVILSM